MQDSFDSPPPTTNKYTVHNNKIVRWVFFLLGFVFVGLAILGVILPGVPTTVFILLAGYCWARSSVRFYGWIMRHKIFGKMLRDWQERRAMPRFAKYLAWGMMTASCAFLFFKLSSDRIWMAIMTTAICVLTAVWMARLPDA